jgi:ring-1,2-phenylacetyl-CoA epoxidase subunit PaaB
LKSLDPRVNRLPEVGTIGKMIPKVPLDQFGTFEVFVQPKEGKPFQHEGIVHAPSLELAYVLAKETYTRRFTCYSLYVIETRDVYVTPLLDGNQNVYDALSTQEEKGTTSFEIYHLPKRGKQHVHVGTVQANSVAGAIHQAKLAFANKATLNVWVLETNKIRFTSPEEQELWLTLPEKKFRDASNYKGGDKLNDFLAKHNFVSSQN